jgi:hypothetical protein
VHGYVSHERNRDRGNSPSHSIYCAALGKKDWNHSIVNISVILVEVEETVKRYRQRRSSSTETWLAWLSNCDSCQMRHTLPGINWPDSSGSAADDCFLEVWDLFRPRCRCTFRVDGC